MKAVVCKQYGPPESLTFEELPSPRPGPGEAVVRVKAASVNFPDFLIIQNKYQYKPPLPFSPGSELAGVVKEVGDGVEGFKPGDKVIAFTAYGAFAEEVKTEATRLLPMPEGMDFPSAAAFLVTYGTSDHALRDRGALSAGETLLVLGAAGGVGLAAVEVGKALGARQSSSHPGLKGRRYTGRGPLPEKPWRQPAADWLQSSFSTASAPRPRRSPWNVRSTRFRWGSSAPSGHRSRS
ncbi:MAG: hypothetical protein A3G81_22225 [Betaproteobacteria bacterium RIFCSPLOWO2_12_FULL_65_14]|nr:MAG: hypothetical protein A3G81_22225 [Betaproteobacteria bacterium RIFCSPLOWO2_12_FULL_65_14]